MNKQSIVGAVLIVAIGAAAAVAGAAQEPGWQKALTARSDALNRAYELGAYAHSTQGASEPGWLQALNLRSEALNRKYSLGSYARTESAAPTGSKVKVRITFKNDGRDVSDGKVAGAGDFNATGAITDKGTVLIYRTMKPGLITLRYVTVGKKGTITFVVKININLGTSRWTITSGTKAYKGLHGRGTESENPPKYTISILAGTVSR